MVIFIRYRRIILCWIFMIWGVDWIDLAKDRDRCRAVVNTVMKFKYISNYLNEHLVSTKCGEFRN
jgi:hypothetical protein